MLTASIGFPTVSPTDAVSLGYAVVGAKPQWPGNVASLSGPTVEPSYSFGYPTIDYLNGAQNVTLMGDAGSAFSWGLGAIVVSVIGGIAGAYGGFKLGGYGAKKFSGDKAAWSVVGGVMGAPIGIGIVDLAYTMIFVKSM